MGEAGSPTVGSNIDLTMAFQNRIKRRTFIKGGLAAALSPLLLSSAAAAPERSVEVVVIGAGISGLSAAKWLYINDYDVVVVEGRNRLGGRLWSDHSLGFPVDLGASWIVGARGNPIQKICQKADIKTIADPDRWQYRSPSGKALPDKAEQQLEEMVNLVLAVAGPELSQHQAVQQAIGQHRLSTDQSLILREIYNGIATDFGALPQNVSVMGLQDSVYSGPNRLIPGGYVQVAEHLARDLEVRLGETVQTIRWSKSGVEVSTTRGLIRAHRAIVTLPLGVLQRGSVKFDPPLPEPQQEALNSLKMGLLNKLVLMYPKAFWPSEYQHFANLTEDVGVFGEIANLKALFQKNGLLLFLAGQPAWKREGWQQSRLKTEAEKILHDLFPGTNQVATAAVSTRWGSDPFSFGSYSYLPKGVSPKMRSLLAEPQSPLFFAGEATHETMSATVHGAYLSGLRAAEELDDDWS
jgi:monoamine oxidase